MPKLYPQTYLYKTYPEYDKKMFEFIMTANRIDTSSVEFEDVLYDIKRRKVSDFIIKVLMSNNTIIGYTEGKSLPKAFKVFVAKDVKEDKDKMKVFIDVGDCVFFKNGKYVCNHVDWIGAYLVNATTSYIYNMMENKITGNASVLKDGGAAFVKCFSYIMDRIYKISTVQSLRKKVEYAAALYYQINILGKDFSKNFDSIKANAIRIADIESREAAIIDVMMEETSFLDINTFVTSLGSILKLKDFNISIFLDMWMKSFGTGTIFAMEYFPAFSAMMTNTYIGGYIDQQTTIEKIAGQDMIRLSKTILQIGSSVV